MLMTGCIYRRALEERKKKEGLKEKAGVKESRNGVGPGLYWTGSNILSRGSVLSELHDLQLRGGLVGLVFLLRHEDYASVGAGLDSDGLLMVKGLFVS